MKTEPTTVTEYLAAIPEERKIVFHKLRDTILKNIPHGFEECISYKMIGYVVPHHIYTKGYHCNPKLPLPFVSIANQKNFIALYHMGLYMNPELYNWFINEYTKICNHKIDIGKSCICFKKTNDIPFDLIAELIIKISITDWILTYEASFKKNK